MEDLPGLKPGPGETPHCVQWIAGRAEIFATGDTGGYQLKAGIRVLAHRAEEMNFTNTQTLKQIGVTKKESTKLSA